MLNPLSWLLKNLLSPKHTVVGGGTESRTASGELRWSFRWQYHEDWQKKHDAYASNLIELGHLEVFESFAQAMRNLPESVLNSGSEWSDALSSAARLFFIKLDALQAREPRIALKIAAIAAGCSYVHFVFAKDATQRMCDWLLRGAIPIRERLALGLLIREKWPGIDSPELLDKGLLELFEWESRESPESVAQIFRSRWLQRGNCTAYAVSFGDDPAKLLTIGRNLKSIEPEYCKNVFSSYLFSGRLNHGGFSPLESDLRCAAAEYFELESVLSPSTPMAGGKHYFNLSQWAYRDASWYPEVQERLFAAAQACEDLMLAADWYRAVVMNADRQSAVFARSMDAFGQYVRTYTELPSLTDDGLVKLARFLVETLEIATIDQCRRGRNIDLPPDPQHPIVNVARDTYWGFVSWAAELPSAVVLPILVEAVERGENEFGQGAANRMLEVFEVKARADANVAASALGQLSRYEWYSDVTEPRKSRCLGLVRKLMPKLEALSPRAAHQARLSGRNPLWDR